MPDGFMPMIKDLQRVSHDYTRTGSPTLQGTTQSSEAASRQLAPTKLTGWNGDRNNAS
ncbi:MAG: hypothetical protein ACKVP2_16545 [Burkholderiales bacterium]